jgi:protein-S-isoprenylcysteine O-methyltransferase Ste14
MCAQLAIRVYHQRRIRRGQSRYTVRERKPSLIAGAIAALAAIVFGLEYLIAPGTFAFAYILAYPLWLRFTGAVILTGGVVLLGLSHYHLDLSFHSFIVQKEEQVLVETGPYRWIRHPIYLAYLVNYASGGLVASNWVLTFVPTLFFALLAALRMGPEEAAMVELFGERYHDYMESTGRLLPRLRPSPASDLDDA